MKVTPVKTHKITQKDKDILQILERYLPAGRQGIKNLSDKSVIAVTSKIVSICEGRMVKIGSRTKDELVEEEAQLYLPRHMSKYDFCISIKHNIFTASAGIDESNGNGSYILWT